MQKIPLFVSPQGRISLSLALMLLGSPLAHAGSFSYGFPNGASFNYEDPSCPEFEMDRNGAISCRESQPQLPDPVGACSITPSGSTTIEAGKSLTLNASCPNATSYVWKLNGATVGSSAVYATPTSLAAGTYTYTVTGSNSRPSSSSASIAVQVKPKDQPPGDGSISCNGVTMPGKVVEVNTQLPGSPFPKKLYTPANPDAVYAFKITVPANQVKIARALSVIDTTSSANKTKRITVSQCRGDYAPANKAGGCTARNVEVSGVTAVIGYKETEAPSKWYCHLQPGQTYWVNVSFRSDPSSTPTCTSSSDCSFGFESN